MKRKNNCVSVSFTCRKTGLLASNRERVAFGSAFHSIMMRIVQWGWFCNNHWSWSEATSSTMCPSLLVYMWKFRRWTEVVQARQILWLHMSCTSKRPIRVRISHMNIVGFCSMIIQIGWMGGLKWSCQLPKERHLALQVNPTAFTDDINRRRRWSWIGGMMNYWSCKSVQGKTTGHQSCEGRSKATKGKRMHNLCTSWSNQDSGSNLDAQGNIAWRWKHVLIDDSGWHIYYDARG